MLCYISFMNINIDNIDKWEQILIKTKSNDLSVCEKRILDNFDVYTIIDYINLIKSNIHDETKITEIIKNYNFKKNKRLVLEREKENEELRKKILNSIKFSSIDHTVKIQLLIDTDSNNAIELYQKFKISMNEDIHNTDDYIDDFILKNLIFGIFKNDNIIGFVIIDYSKKFNIGEKISTFYIQELFIDDKYRNNGYADLLIKYCLLICPNNMKYISFMTMPTNNIMYNIAIKYNFKLYEKLSGDIKHSSLFIRINDNDNEKFKSSFL
jgi:ribosomal protein S18 acetylase RimI-like enzyme